MLLLFRPAYSNVNVSQSNTNDEEEEDSNNDDPQQTVMLLPTTAEDRQRSIANVRSRVSLVTDRASAVRPVLRRQHDTDHHRIPSLGNRFRTAENRRRLTAWICESKDGSLNADWRRGRFGTGATALPPRHTSSASVGRWSSTVTDHTRCEESVTPQNDETPTDQGRPPARYSTSRNVDHDPVDHDPPNNTNASATPAEEPQIPENTEHQSETQAAEYEEQERRLLLIDRATAGTVDIDGRSSYLSIGLNK